MKQLLLLAILACLPIAIFAQSNFDEEVNAELDKMYQRPHAASSKSAGLAAQPDVQVNVQQTQTPTQVVAPQQQVMPVMQKQPVTYIEATPLQESKAEQLRRARQNTELFTEQKIVEKLEQSRMEDEKRRADALFGDKLNAMASGTNQAAPVAAVVPEQEVKASKQEEKINRDTVREEVSAALSEMKEKEKPTRKTYFSALAGTSDYPDAKNVRGNYSLGFAVGGKFNDRLLVEGSMLYSNFSVEQMDWHIDPRTGLYYPRITSMDQYNLSALVKYQFLGGMFRPVFGGVASYSYRNFKDQQFALMNNDASSHAIDMGLMTGVDLEFSETFSLGLDFRYMWNVTSQVDNNSYQRSFSSTVLNGGTPIEKLSYMNVMVVGRASF